MNTANARVILLGGPSGSGKSYIAHRTGLPVLCLDDFYRDGSEPDLPRTAAGTVDWEAPASWDAEAALAAIATLCRDGRADTPIYAIGADRRVGRRTVDLAGAELFVAEGIFATEVVPACRDRGLLAGAYALRRSRGLTFARRLARDLIERRKPPRVLVRRGLTLLRSEPGVLARAEELGARPVPARTLLAEAARLTRS